MVADEEAREAQVIVPDNQLSLAIGKEGQNARLSAKLTGFKIDIKSETQAKEMGLLDEIGLQYETEEGNFGTYEDDYNYGESYEGSYEEDYGASYEDSYQEDYGREDQEQEGYGSDYNQDVNQNDYQKDYQDGVIPE